MSETQVLLGRIVALRQRLEQARASAHEAGAAAAGCLEGPARVTALDRRAAQGDESDHQLEAALRPLAPAASGPSLPAQLTARARRALERGRDLFQALRELSDEPTVQDAGNVAAALYRETASLTDAALRLVQALPDSPGVQLQQCEGIEALLTIVAGRVAQLAATTRRQRVEAERLALLTSFLTHLEAGTAVDLGPVTALSGTLLEEAAGCAPLRFLHPPSPAVADAAWVARAVACHGLTVAQVIARVVRHEPDLKHRAQEAVTAALLHDAGMLRVAPALLTHPGLLDDAGRRALEAHCRAGAELLGRLPDAAGLVEAAAHHHERADGTGYPDGLRGEQVMALTRLLTVCDVYAAQCCARPHRPARETRTALADTLLLAESGAVDRHFAERLLQLAFYPVGAVVEMADGAVGVVVATPAGRRDLNAPARPVVALLTDGHSRFLPAPRHIDLAQGDSHSIVRTLTPAERHRVLGTRYPEWAA